MAFLLQGVLATWTLYVLLFASLRSVNAEREPYLRDIIDSNGVLSEHTLHTAATGYSVEALRMEDQNQLEFDTISLEDIDSNLIHAYVSLFSMTIDGSWNSKTWWKLPTITFLLLEENLSGDREWIERINLDVIWDGIFCCPFAEYWATQGKCGMQCQGYSLPFLVKQHFTRVPVITKIGIMDQRIATYCFLSRETSEKVTVTDISHSFRGHDALSKVTISNMSPKLTSVAYKLYSTRGMCEIIKKSIVIEKIEPTVVELRIGHGVSVGQPIWFPFNVHSGNTANASIVSRQYQHRVQRAQYSCLKSGVVLTGDQLDNVQIEAMRDADALIIYFVVNITVNEEGNYGLYDCFLRLEVLSQSASHRDTEKQIVYKLYFRTIQINPVHWKEQALAAHSMLTELSRSHKRINEGIKDIENIMDYTDHQLHNMSEYIKPCKACYDERYIFYTIYGIIILAGLFALIAMICICTCVTCERSRVHRQTISTLENLDSSGVSGSSEPEYDVFLSYCSTDREWVENELVHKLERSGYMVCYDQRNENFPPGRTLEASIQHAILTCRKTVAVFSPDYLSSDWAQYELIMVHTKKTEGVIPDDSLVVIKYRPCEIPTDLRRIKYNDWTDPKIGRLLEKLYACLPYFLAKIFPVTLTDETKKQHFWDGLLQNIGHWEL